MTYPFKKIFSGEALLLVFLVVAFIVLRAWHFNEWYNFSTDQAVFSERAFELWQNKEITFVGPTASLNYQGHFLIQSSAIFYVTMLFQVLASFEPLRAGFYLTLAASLSVIPLYFGVKRLTSGKWALLVTAIFTFLPFYVQYTRFLWNPNYQLILLPYGVWIFSNYWQTRKAVWAFASGVAAGALLLFHYQFLLVITGVSLLILMREKLRGARLFWWLVGCTVGFLPMIAFEIRSHFYLTQTVFLLITHAGSAAHSSATSGQFPWHYLLSLSLVSLIAVVMAISWKWPKFLTAPKVSAAVAVLIIFSMVRLWPVPGHSYGGPADWNYLNEDQVSQIIAAQKLDNFAVVNTFYETTASVQYYLLKTRNVPGWTKDYTKNRYLFVITGNQSLALEHEIAYELQTFQPAHLRQTWQVSPQTFLLLFEH